MEPYQIDIIRRAVTHYEAGNALLRELLKPEVITIQSTKPTWPIAVPTQLIVRPGQRPAAIMRARQIIDQISQDLTGISLLDFGCGEGWSTLIAAESAAYAVGYDPIPHDTWDLIDRGNISFTTSPPLSRQYDIILCHDVLDHVSQPLLDVMLQLRQMLSPSGTIYLRFHPWTARHGGHQYETDGNNLAYWHLSVIPDELIRLPSHRVIRPLSTYDNLVREAGFRIIDRKVENVEPEAYFSGDILDSIIRNTWDRIDCDQARKIMAIQHVDYVLRIS